MIEVDVIGRGRFAASGPSPASIRRLCALAAGSAGIRQGHLAVHFVSEARIADLNARHRDRNEPTDVLAFPIDGVDPVEDADGAPGAGREASSSTPPRELGDVVICPPRTVDLREAIVHGVLHLVGMDHETDDGEMLVLQAELLAEDAQP